MCLERQYLLKLEKRNLVVSVIRHLFFDFQWSYDTFSNPMWENKLTWFSSIGLMHLAIFLGEYPITAQASFWFYF